MKLRAKKAYFGSKGVVTNIVNVALFLIYFSLFSLGATDGRASDSDAGDKFVGIMAVALEVVLSGFASIYFEKVVKGVGGGNGPLLGIFEVRRATHFFCQLP